MAVGLSLIRLMVGSRWVAGRGALRAQAPPQDSEQVRVFGAPVSFGHAANAFVMERELLDRQVPAADPRLYPILRRYLDQVLSEMPQEDDLLASVRRTVGESMRNGDPKLAQVAGKGSRSGRARCRGD